MSLDPRSAPGRRAKAGRLLRLLAPVAALILLAGIASEIDARGGGGRGGGGYRGGGGGYRGGGGGYRGGGGYGGVSRGGPARGGSVRYEQSGGGYRTNQRSGSGGWGESGSRQRDGSFENRRGETIDYSGSATRTPDGVHREGSWQSSSGASGGGSGDIKVKDGQVQSRDRTGHAENAKGETIDREVQSERHGDHVDREARTKTSTGVKAESKGTIKKTDDGFIARGGVVGKDGAAAGTIARKGDQTRVRGAATDGDHVTWGGANCKGGHCYGGRATVKVNDYYNYPYYYYPYYYGWYSCPYGGIRTWNGYYGTPVYGCANVVVIHTTISLGEASTSNTAPLSAAETSSEWPREAQVSSAPVLMYEVSPDVVSYATTYAPKDVYAEKKGEYYFWVPGPAKDSPDASESIETAGAMPQPTANATVITYEIGDETVYLTNEKPIPGYYAGTADYLYVWIPGVKEPTDKQRDAIETAITAHKAGGKKALDREVRKLEASRPAPPDAEGMDEDAKAS